MLKNAQAGKEIKEDDIPPPVFVKDANQTANELSNEHKNEVMVEESTKHIKAPSGMIYLIAANSPFRCINRSFSKVTGNCFESGSTITLL